MASPDSYGDQGKKGEEGGDDGEELATCLTRHEERRSQPGDFEHIPHLAKRLLLLRSKVSGTWS